jgi:porphobilinogen deaminase
LGGGCQVPIGVHCRPSPDQKGRALGSCEIFAVVASPDTGACVRVHHRTQLTDPAALGHTAADMLLAAGAGALLAAAVGASPGAAP